MARTNSLTNFLTDVADAIRAKTGGSAQIAAEDFDTEIENISGGGSSSYAPSYISFANFGGESLDDEVAGLDTSNMTTMFEMFNNCAFLTSLDLSNFDTSNVTDMAYMFNGCNSLTTLDLSSFDTTSIESMQSMFYDCSSLSFLDIRDFDFSSVVEYTDMFYEVPSDCEIIVADSEEKDWMETNFPEMENVKTVAEYEAEQNA